MKMKLIAFALAAFFAAALLTCLFAATFGPTEFADSVSVRSSWSAISNISITATSGGTYTNATTWTNYYRICGTNALGRIPVSSNCVVSFTGGTNGTNAVYISWPRKDGVANYTVEKSLDQGVTWTNWLSLGPTLTNWTDSGTNTWTTGSSPTSLYSVITAPVIDLEDASEVRVPGDGGTNTAASKGYVTNHVGTAITGKVDIVDWQNSNATLQAGIDTNAAAISILDTGKVSVTTWTDTNAAVQAQLDTLSTGNTITVYRVTGTLSPDATGDYWISTNQSGHHIYYRTDSQYRIFAFGDTATIISPVSSTWMDDSMFWSRDNYPYSETNIVGAYVSGGAPTGTPTVTPVYPFSTTSLTGHPYARQDGTNLFTGPNTFGNTLQVGNASDGTLTFATPGIIRPLGTLTNSITFQNSSSVPFAWVNATQQRFDFLNRPTVLGTNVALSGDWDSQLATTSTADRVYSVNAANHTNNLFALGSVWPQCTNAAPWNIFFDTGVLPYAITLTNWEAVAEGGTMVCDLATANRTNAVRNYTTVWTNFSASTTYSNLIFPAALSVTAGNRIMGICTNMTGVGSNMLWSIGGKR